MSEATGTTTPNSPAPFLRPKEAAHELATSRSNVYRLAAMGLLEIRRLPGVGPRIPRASLEAYLAKVS